MSQHLTTSSIPVPGTSQPSTPRQPRRRRWRRVVLGLLALFLFVFWFAPTIVAKTPLRNRIARAVAADLKGTLEIGGASLGWLSPIELRDVTLTDAQGRVMARIPKLTSSKTLLSLLRDRADFGAITLERPSLEIVCEKDGSNIEESIEQYLRSPECPGPTRTAIVVNVVQGSLALKEAGRDGGGDIRNIDATVTIPISRAEPIAARVSADAPGRVEAELSAGDGGTMKLAANGLALEYLAPVLQRIDQGMSLAGAMTADCTAAWGKDSASIEGKLAVRSLSLSLPEMNGETLRLADAELPVKAAIVGRNVRIDRADFTCDIGTVSVVGRFDPEESFDRFLEQEAVKLDAAVDIAKLAAALPKLLHVRDGTEFREGKLVVKVASKHGENGTTWTGGISTSALKASRDGREIKWEEPLDIQFEGHANSGRLPTLKKLTCKSDFIGINAQVSPDSARAAANIYLDKLAERLAEFVDLQGWTLDGRGSAWIIASRTASGEFKAEGGVELARFAMLDRAGKGIREPELKMQLAATGYAAENKPVTVTTMSVSLAAGKDDLRVKLLEPIPDIKELSGGKFDATVDGELSRWWKRLGLGVSLPQDYVVAGKITARGVGSFASGTLKVDRLALAIEHPRFRGAGIDLSEPKLNAEADVVVDRNRHTATFADLTIAAAPLSITRGSLVIESRADGSVAVRGEGPANTDLNRLGKSLGLFSDPLGPNALRGNGAGRVQFQYSGDVVTFGGNLDVADFAFGPEKEPEWFEKRLRVEVDGSYTRSSDTLAFKSAMVERRGLSLAAAGTIGKFDSTTDAKLDGTLTYDMDKLTPKLRELLGGNFAATGKGSKILSLAGSLTPEPRPNTKHPPNLFASIKAELGIGWDSLKAYGFDVGPGELRAKLADGFVHFTPVHATFGGGKVTLHPSARLDPEPGGATFAKGKIVERARLTPEVCASALGFALPAIAHSNKIEGEVSITLGDNHIPLADTSKSTAKAVVLIHKATLTAGPVIGEVARFLGADRTTMTLADGQSVSVRVENGRVYHDGLTIKVGGYFVKTSGSVGFDGSIDLVVDAPIPGGLPGLKNTPAIAKSLTGKRVSVPIRGTLSQPALDARAFQLAVAKLAQSAAKDIGRDLLNRELKKLFPEGMPAPGGFFPIPKK